MSVLTTDLTISDDEEQTRTYYMSESKVQGFVDGIGALQQAIYKILNTEKYEYPIYSFDYGIEMEDLIGKDPTYVKVEFRKRVQEVLLNDSRIKSVDNFDYSISGDSMTCTFDVVSIYGNINIEQEVI